MDRASLHLPARFGERAADLVVTGMGSWRFVIVQTIAVAGWIGLNLYLLSRPFDPFPFILLNLAFSTQAAYASPLILMASNRQAAKDRARDDLEAREVDELTGMNRQQLDILRILHDLQTRGRHHDRTRGPRLLSRQLGRSRPARGVPDQALPLPPLPGRGDRAARG